MSVAPFQQRSQRWAEFGLLGLGIALAISSARLFVNPSAVWGLASIATIAWATAAICRRLRWPELTSDLLFLAIGLGGLVVSTARHTLRYYLPSLDTVRYITDLVRTDLAELPLEIAPVDARVGHVILLSALIWVSAGYLSTAAMTIRLTIWAPLPHLGGIVALGVLARGEGRLLTTTAMLVALGIYILTQANWRLGEWKWVPAIQPVIRRTLPSGATILGLGAIVGIAASTLMPWGTDPVLNYRENKDGSTTNVVSPFVEVGSYLGSSGSDSLLFTARSERPEYWRLTALDEYDAEAGIWVLSNSYESAPEQLEPVDSDQVSSQIAVQSLGGFWVPSPNSPTTVASPLELAWDPEASSLISADRDLETSDSAEFTANSSIDPVTLQTASAAEAEGVLLDTSGTPEELKAVAAELGAGKTPYEQALAIQNWARTEFTYDDTVDLRNSGDPMAEFLAVRRGFCQQFATMFALAARSLGLPTRVVVGFTPGEILPEGAAEQGGDGTTYAVYGRQAHSWPEVLFDGVGWISFEPTPGRGDPSTQAITGVPAGQATEESTGGAFEFPTTSVPTPTTPSLETPAIETPAADPAPTEVSTPATEESALWGWILLAGLATSVAILLYLRQRGRHVRNRNTDAISLEWELALERLSSFGMTPTPSETPAEFSARVSKRLKSDSIIHLATLEGERRWSPRDPGTEEIAEAHAASEEFAKVLELAGSE